MYCYLFIIALGYPEWPSGMMNLWWKALSLHLRTVLFLKGLPALQFVQSFQALKLIVLFNRCVTAKESQFWEAITNHDKSHKCTVFTTSACESTATRTCGSISRTFSTTFHWRLSSMARSSVCTVVSHPLSTHSITSDRLIVCKKCRTRWAPNWLLSSKAPINNYLWCG